MDADTKRIDLGDDHWYQFTSWAPDLNIPENAGRYAHLEHIRKQHPRVGAIVGHRKSDGGECQGSITFITPLTDAVEYFRQHDRWSVEKWDPLTLSPSLSCHCGDHGHIKEGRWVRA